MPKEIKDKFSVLKGKVSRQRISQKRAIAAGLCMTCGAENMGPYSMRCSSCYTRHQATIKIWRAANPEKMKAYREKAKAKRAAIKSLP